MLIVVLGNKLINPGARCFDSFERLAWIGRRVLECTEQAFRVWVVVAHRWPAERWHYAQPLQRRQHGRALHGTPVISVQDQLPAANTFRQASFADQGAGMLRQFLGVDFPADDLATEDVLNHVQPIELPTTSILTEGAVGDPLPRSIVLAVPPDRSGFFLEH